MAPKKTAIEATLAKNTQDKKGSGLIRLKIPVDSLSTRKKMPSRTVKVKKEAPPKITKKQLGDLLKLDLANAVAYEQLVKKNPTTPNNVSAPTNLVGPMVDPQPAKKRGRNKNLNRPPEPTEAAIESITIASVTDSEEAFEVKSPQKRKYVRKISAKANAVKKPTVTNKIKATVAKPAPLKKKTPEKKPQNTKTQPLRTPTIITIPAKKLQKKPPSHEPRTRNEKLLTPKGKPEEDVTSPTETKASPSLLGNVESDLPKKVSDNALESPKNDVKTSLIDSRKSSLTSASECLSWTKDISSSSTATYVTVCSNDFVRIDKKIPVLKLSDLKLQKSVKLNNNSESLSDSDSSSSESSTVASPVRPSSPEMDSHSLALSTSSVTHISCDDKNATSEMSPMDIALAKLKSKLENFDMEIVNWISYDSSDEDVNVKMFQDKVFTVLKEESEVILHCQRLKRVLAGEADIENVVREQDNAKVIECHDKTVTEDIVSVTACQISVANKDNSKSYVLNNELENSCNVPAATGSDKSEDNEKYFTSEKSKYVSYDHSCDDDDALSLYAESITGIESSRVNSSVASTSKAAAVDDLEEYVPQPISAEKAEKINKINYVPSKILSDDVQSNELKRIICEKQNADSTSISKVIKMRPMDAMPDFNYSSQNNNCIITFDKKKAPCLMSSLFKSFHGTKSVIFHGICFYNLLLSCKSGRCRYPHIMLEEDVVVMKLVTLSEEDFIKEYMLLRSWPVLRRKYGMCFLEECKRRQLTRILVEMAIDYHAKANENIREDSILRVAVIESVLLYLNDIDLVSCWDLLLCTVQRNIALCDIFMQTIANTQNFSRFKQVFIKLTDFIIRHEKLFNLTVATQILERVCILPYEQPLSQALMGIVEHTNSAIFEHSVISTFEKYLSVLNPDLYRRLLALKKESTLHRPVLKSLYDVSPRLNVEMEPVINSFVHTERERYTSPDTTNLDNMNKALEEQTVTRTVDFSRGRFGINIQRSFNNSNSSTDSNDEFRSQGAKTTHYQMWKGQSVLNKIHALSPVNHHVHAPAPTFPTPPIIKRRIHQRPSAGPTPPKFPRRTGPDFY